MDEKLLEGIRKLLGAVKVDDGKATVPDDAAIEAAFKGTKFVDLEGGGYVAKDKFETAETKRKTAEKAADDAKKELDDVKKAQDGDDSPAAQLEALKGEIAKETAAREAAEARALKKEREALVADKVASPKLRRTLLADAEALLDDDTDFDAALAKAIEADPDYAPPEEEPEPIAKVGFGPAPKGQPMGDKFKSAVDQVFDGGAKEG